MTGKQLNKLEKIALGVAYGGLALAGVSLAKFVTDNYYHITTGSHNIDENAIYGFGAGMLITLVAATVGGASYSERKNSIRKN